MDKRPGARNEPLDLKSMLLALEILNQTLNCWQKGINGNIYIQNRKMTGAQGEEKKSNIKGL